MTMENVNFDINEALKNYMSDPATIPTPEADSALFECENEPEALTNAVIDSVLNPIVDAVADNPEAITRAAHVDSLQFLLKCVPVSSGFSGSPSSVSVAASSCERPLCFPRMTISNLFELSRHTTFLSTHSLSKLFDLIMSGLSAEADSIHNDLESPDDPEALSHHKQLLEIYGFLLQWTIAAVETKAAEKSSAQPVARGRGKSKKSTPKGQEGVWDSSRQLQGALDVMCKVLKLKLSKIFLTTSERDTFIGLLTRPVYMVLENEQRVKDITIRMHTFKVLCIAVKHHGHGYGRVTSGLTGHELKEGRLTWTSRANQHCPEPHLLRTPF